MSTAAHPPSDALFHALASGALPASAPGQRVLCLRARACPGLQRHREAGWVVQQSFRPHADALARLGVETTAVPPDARFDLVLAFPPRHRAEARALLAQAVARTAPGGSVVAAMGNDEGARSGEKDLALLAGGQGGSLSKFHCRVFWTPPRGTHPADAALIEAWEALDAPRPILDGRYVSRPGLFAWDRVDAASALLAAHLPAGLHGRVADLGAGWGYLATELLRRCPHIAALDLYEAEARALAPARANLDAALQAREAPVEVGVHWHDVAGGLPRRYDAIVSNPPFHQDRADAPALGQAFIAAAAGSLETEGALYLVANRHLPYETTLAARFSAVDTLAQAQGFKVIRARGVRT